LGQRALGRRRAWRSLLCYTRRNGDRAVTLDAVTDTPKPSATTPAYTRYSSGSGGGGRVGGNKHGAGGDGGGRARSGRSSRSARLRLGRRSWLVVAFVVLVAATVLFGLADYGYSKGKIHRGVTVYGVPVGGLTPTAAAAELGAVPTRGGEVVLKDGAQKWTLNPATLKATIDGRAAAKAAFRYTRAGGLVVVAWRRLSLWFSSHDLQPDITFDQPSLKTQLDDIARVVEVKAEPATVTVDGTKPVVKAARAGVALDRVAVERLLARAIITRRTVTGPLPIVTDKPAVTTSAARAAADQARAYLAGPITLTYKGRKWRLTTNDLASYLTFVPQGGASGLKATFGSPVMRGCFAYLTGQIGTPARDAGFRVSGTHVHVVPGKPGQGVAEKATVRNIEQAALRSGSGRTAAIVFGKTKPELTYAEAKAMHITTRIGTYTTSVAGTLGRLANVQLGSSLLDNALVAPGKIFSVNETTGERTAANGFQVAPVIINGQLQDSIGGGMCQVSTTLFNAAFEAGLQIVERHNHSLYISHYPLGRDATVSYGAYDLKFRNDTKNWILVKSFYGGGYLTFSLYSAPLHRRVVSSVTGWYNIRPMTIRREKTDTLAKGKTEVKTEGFSGRSITCYRKVYDENGKLLWNDTFVSVYPMYPEVLLVGTREKPKPSPSPSDSGAPTPKPSGTLKPTPKPT